MKWLQANAAVVLSVVVVVWLGAALVRALVIASRRRQRPSPIEEFERAEHVKARIRRTIADRKANPLPPPGPVGGPAGQPRPRPRVSPIDPFGGPSRRRWWSRVRQWFARRREKNRIAGAVMR